MKFLEKIKKIIEYIKNLEFQKKIILALIVVLVIANLVLGIFLFYGTYTYCSFERKR